MLILALSGYKNVGKDTVSNYIKTKVPHAIITKFAEPLKQCASAIYSVPRDYWEYDKETTEVELYGKTKREVLQTLGAGIRHLLDEDIWILSLDRWLVDLVNYSYDSTNLVIIIDDLRHINELKYVKGNKGKVIYIDKNIKFEDQHESESYYGYIKLHADYILDNNKDLDHLYKQVDTLLQELKL